MEQVLKEKKIESIRKNAFNLSGRRLMAELSSIDMAIGTSSKDIEFCEQELEKFKEENSCIFEKFMDMEASIAVQNLKRKKLCAERAIVEQVMETRLDKGGNNAQG